MLQPDPIDTTNIRKEIDKIIDKHTMEWKAGHNHLIGDQLEALITLHIREARIETAKSIRQLNSGKVYLLRMANDVGDIFVDDYIKQLQREDT